MAPSENVLRCLLLTMRCNETRFPSFFLSGSACGGNFGFDILIRPATPRGGFFSQLLKCRSCPGPLDRDINFLQVAS